MFKFARFSVVIYLLVNALPASASIDLPAWCRGSECVESTLESKAFIRSGELGKLYEITIRSVRRPINEVSRQRFIEYYGSEVSEEISKSYVLCSTRMPSVLFSSDEGYRLNRLVLTGYPPPNLFWHSHIHYLATCHNLAGPDYFSDNVTNLLLREGYSLGNNPYGNRQLGVREVSDILDPNIY
jgi:hypothetical protein